MHVLTAAAIQDAVKKILKREGTNKSESDKVASFLRSSWTEIPDRKSTSRFVRPRYVSNKADHATQDNEDGGDGLKNTGKRLRRRAEQFF
jgi:hypothetical protein